MSAGHVFYTSRESFVHRMPGHIKILVSVVFTILVVATPREAYWAFAAYTVLIGIAAACAKIGPLWLLGRSMIELPFVILVVILPFTGSGETTQLWGLTVSIEGSLGAWNIIAKATLGVWSSLLLAGTTTQQQLLAGLDKLRCPSVISQIAAFMIRYVHVIIGEAKRMRIARLARGDDPRFLWQLKGYATGIGALFLRSFERGERVYLAMLSRGYTGDMALASHTPHGTVIQWVGAVGVIAIAVTIMLTAILV